MIGLHSVLYVLAAVVIILAGTMLVPLGFSLALADGIAAAHAKSVAVTAACGTVLLIVTRKRRAELRTRDGFLLVALVWSLLPAFATLPLLWSLENLSFTDAYFETMSGMTTTGSTTLSGLDNMPPSIHVWRTFLVWMGGMGIIVLTVGILPLLGVGGSQLFKAETPGPMKDTKLTPRITQTAKALWLVYTAVTVVCVISYRIAGMDWLDALVHAFSTMGLGGFSSHDDSFGYFKSPAIEAVAIVFMLISGINFGAHFLAFRAKSFLPYRRDPEAGAFLGITVASCIGIGAYLFAHGTYDDFWTALRFASFNVVSIATTTGFASTDYNLWPIFAPTWMLFLCCFATCAGSTGGGIKMIRAEVLLRQAHRELRRIIHPRAVIPIKIGGRVIENNVIFAVLAFMLIYGSTVIAGTLLLLASELDIITAFTAVIASINNTGPGLNQVGPATNYAVLTDFQTWVCSILMLLGRLELITIFVVLAPGFWRE